MERIAWCLENKEGIKIVDPDREISIAYLNRSKSDFLEIDKQNEVWKVVISYYACYNALYAVMTRYGLKSRIHSCTIELMSLFRRLKDYKKFMMDLKDMRHDVQYYLKPIQKVNIADLSRFIEECEKEIIECDSKKMAEIRKKLLATLK